MWIINEKKTEGKRAKLTSIYGNTMLKEPFSCAPHNNPTQNSLTWEFFHRQACHGEKSWPLVFRRDKMEYYLKILLPFWISEVPLRPVPVMCLGCGCGVPNSKVFDWRKMELLCQELKRMSKALLISDDRKIHLIAYQWERQCCFLHFSSVQKLCNSF